MNRKRGFIDKLVKELGYTNMKYQYFMWRNKLENIKMDYSKFTEEEFIAKWCKSNAKFKWLQKWEKSEQYNHLLTELYISNIDKDMIKIYEKVKEKALQGDDKAVKTFILLQKELKNLNTTTNTKKIEEVEAVEEEEEDLDITM